MTSIFKPRHVVVWKFFHFFVKVDKTGCYSNLSMSIKHKKKQFE